MTASIVVNPDSPAQSASADIFLKKSSLYVYKQHMCCRARAPLQVPQMNLLSQKMLGKEQSCLERNSNS